ncbi:hypothetical protein QBC46DRAFT_371762 [Diplogelasinospora grovesii]|uniref:Uncharacterized protein n=1 Tax=Diplogelasinospora grovesii TaxID=303347 RepID=A0AAN6S9D2_9PEZI|nr:hypothetical protein QBC46DRAFT_371762 [Diplogelasinospora grovesii]
MDLDSSAGLHVDTTHGASGSGVGTQEDQENDAANEAEDMSSEDLDRRSSSNQSAQPEQEEIDSDDMPPGRSAGNRQPGQALSRRLMPARRDASPGSVRIPSSQNLSANSRRPANRGASRAAANRSGLAEGRVGHDPQGPAWPGAATPRVNRTPSRQPEDRNSRQPRFSPLDRGPDHRRDRSRSPRRTPRPIRTRESYHLANPPETYGRNFAINLGTSRDVHVHYHFHGRYGRPSGEHNHRRGR